MDKKQYKVKVENGHIIPLEFFDLNSPKEGVIIFFDEISEKSKENYNDITTDEKLKIIDSASGMLSDLTEEETKIFEDAIKRRPFFKDRHV